MFLIPWYTGLEDHLVQWQNDTLSSVEMASRPGGNEHIPVYVQNCTWVGSRATVLMLIIVAGSISMDLHRCGDTNPSEYLFQYDAGF